MTAWKQKIGKRLLKHVQETTQRNSLAEVIANIRSQDKDGIICNECISIKNKLGLNEEWRKIKFGEKLKAGDERLRSSGGRA